MRQEEDLPLLKGYITISKAAEELQISRQAAHQMAKDGRLRAWRIASAGSDPVVVATDQVAKLKLGTVQVVTVTAG
jgi:hypothetical protein